jgi:alpha-D-xyloside xylohydrolase
LTYEYEKGASTKIPFHWNEAARTLTIGEREGSFDGMLNERTFNIVLVSKEKPIAFSFTPAPERSIKYVGKLLQIKF